VNANFIDWIWQVRGSLALPPGQSSDDAFDRLDPLFRQDGTTHQRTSGTLIFSKRNQAAQDRMSVFDRGDLRIETGATGSALHYRLTSWALLFCFLAPFLFLGIAQLTIAIDKLDKPALDPPKPIVVTPMNPMDKALGAPAPEPEPSNEAERRLKAEEKKPSPTAAYVFAGIFALLFVVGRILEDRLVKALFRKSLLGSA
jgi:hypothetical protein